MTKQTKETKKEKREIVIHNIKKIYREIEKTPLYTLEKIPKNIRVEISFLINGDLAAQALWMKGVNKITKQEIVEQMIVFYADTFYFWISSACDLASNELNKKQQEEFAFYNGLYLGIHELIHISQFNRKEWKKNSQFSRELEAREKGRRYVKKFFKHKFVRGDINLYAKLSKKYLDDNEKDYLSS